MNRTGTFSLLEATIEDIQAAYRERQMSARELVQLYINRIEALDRSGPGINSIITLNPEALAEAGRLDAAMAGSGPVGPLHGIPVLVKDQVDVKGTPTTLGSVVFKDYYPDQDAFVITRLKQAGAIILAKTTLGEFGGGDTHGTLFGSTHNPYDLERTVGGSSGGSSAGVSANFATVAVGQEGFASIRRPAAWNNVVGMRPTAGLVSRGGVYGGWPSRAGALGPIARTVTDLARLLDHLVGYDAEDPLTAHGFGHKPPTYTDFLDAEALKGARLGILRTSMAPSSKPDSEDFATVTAAFDRAVEELGRAGATLVDPVEIPNLNELLKKRVGGDTGRAFDIWMQRSANPPFKSHEEMLATPGYAQYLALQGRSSTGGRPGAENREAYAVYVQAREELTTNVLKVMADNNLDAIVHKSVEHQPTLIKEALTPPYVTTQGAVYLNTFLVYAASISVPAGFSSDGLPTGITFFGPAFSEPKMLRLAYAYEQAYHHRVPPTTTPRLPDEP